MPSHTITAMFKTRAEAQEAIEALQRTIGLTSVRVLADTDMSGAPASSTSQTEDRGFLASLRDLFVPEEDRPAYAEGVRRGGVLVTASVEESQANRVMDLLEQHGAVDLDAEERRWKESGWTGASGTETGGTATMPHAASASEGTMSAQAASRRPPIAATTTTAAASRATSEAGSQSIPLLEERLVVGKRDVSHGRVKVRSYVVETPVSEQVTLRDEHVSIERRPVDRAVAAGEDAFVERTIEAAETDEEAVVTKEARVREELVLRKNVETREQTVKDTVRRTEVEIEGGRASATPPVATPSGSTSVSSGQPVTPPARA